MESSEMMKMPAYGLKVTKISLKLHVYETLQIMSSLVIMKRMNIAEVIWDNFAANIKSFNNQ